MANRATAAFVFSIVGASYQIISPGVVAIVDRNYGAYFYIIGLNNLLFTVLVVFWSASRLLEDWKGRITWPFITFAVGAANLSSIILASLTGSALLGILGPNGTVSVGAVLAIIPGPLLVIMGGILGFAAVRQYSREHGHAVLGHT
ncbi:MAG: hypothetical protein AUF79_08890 [Crenarchaeota archaeon 13_1_20CM_2_51_8]|nr:MAG: hypothetical protein AUF79_08890 [Crenarchaeota archaeon 13_1_20CM_2_51_8]